MRSPLSLLAAATLLAGGCSYDFQNPAEVLDSGEVTGRAVAEAGSGLAGIAGVRVRLRNSSADLAVEQVTRENGRFVLLGLQPGRHTVLFSKSDTDGNATWALSRDVEVGWGSDGQPEGVILGDVQVRYPVTISGTFSIPASATLAGFTPYAGTVLAYDDATGTRGEITQVVDGSVNGVTPISTFDYRFEGLPVGQHLLRFVAQGTEYGVLPATYTLGPIAKGVDAEQAGQTIPMNALTLALPAAGTGKLRFTVGAPPWLLPPYAWAVSISPTPSPADPLPAPIACPSATCTLDSNGTAEADLAAGSYTVTVTTTPADFTFYDPPPALGIVIPGQTTELGTLYVTDYGVASQQANACVFDVDCGAGASCVDGQCVVPACFTGDFTLECQLWDMACFQPPYSTTPCNGGQGVCSYGPLGLACVPNGLSTCMAGGEPVQAPNCGGAF